MSQIQVIQQLLERDEQNASLWFLLGMEYVLVNQRSAALEAFGRALQHGDDKLRIQVSEQLIALSEASQEEASTGKQSQSVVPQEDTIELNQGVSDTKYLGVMRLIQGGREHQPEKVEETVTFESVGGLEEVKKSIRMKIIEPFMSPGLFERFRKKSGGGILLYGPPGCGKTFIAKATAGECRAKFIPVHIHDILDPYIGVSERQMHDVFTTARAGAPSILFFDEVDTLGYHRGKSTSHALRGVIDQLLTELDGLNTSTEQILVIGATNMPWDVDPAFKRPGRFDRLMFVPPPDLEARRVIFELKLTGRPTKAIDLDELASMTELYSGADIENVVEYATEHVIEDIMRTGTERPIEMDDLRTAVKRTSPSTVEWLRTVKTYVKYGNQSGQYDDVHAFLSKYKQI